MIIGILLVVAAITSTVLTWLLRLYALKNSVMDVPNHRSSHSVPTPRGGGLAIVIGFLFYLFVCFTLHIIDGHEAIGYIGAGLMVAGIGFWDDHGHVSARWRLLCHIIASAWGLYWLGGLAPLVFFNQPIDLQWIGWGFAILYLTWLLNLYNFMDGIDGIAGIEAVTVCIGGVILYWVAAPEGSIFAVTILLMASVLGFLVWNFPSAKIFMGDAGSGFVGLMLGLLSVHAAKLDPELFWGWLILLGAFIVDATYTLLSRMARGERFYEAHCSHAYQTAARKFKSHKAVSLSFGVINLFWLLPIAFSVVEGWLNGVFGTIIAYLPLIYFAYLIRREYLQKKGE